MNPPYIDMPSYFVLCERKGGRGERFVHKVSGTLRRFVSLDGLPAAQQSAGNREVFAVSPSAMCGGQGVRS